MLPESRVPGPFDLSVVRRTNVAMSSFTASELVVTVARQAGSIPRSGSCCLVWQGLPHRHQAFAGCWFGGIAIWAPYHSWVRSGSLRFSSAFTRSEAVVCLTWRRLRKAGPLMMRQSWRRNTYGVTGRWCHAGHAVKLKFP